MPSISRQLRSIGGDLALASCLGHVIDLHPLNSRKSVYCYSEDDFLVLLLSHPSGLARHIDAIISFEFPTRLRRY